jgi:hypothetical protein
MSCFGAGPRAAVGMSKSDLPGSLVRLLREANVQDSELSEIHTKLNERTTSQIVSYLQLAWINLHHSSIANREFIKQLDSHQERTVYAQLLSDRVSDLRS